jgi:uncharacterized protein (TIGR02231 family)
LGTQKVHFKPKHIPAPVHTKNKMFGMPTYSARALETCAYQAPAMMMCDSAVEVGGMMAPLPPQAMQLEAETHQSLLSTMFDIPRECTIPSDNSEHKVVVGIIDLLPDFSYHCTPHLTTDVFLKAEVTNSSVYAFLPGTANVFLDNNYVCQTRLKAVSPGEKFSCSLGTDASIKVTYNPVHTHHETYGMLRKNHVKTFTQNIKVKNTKSDEVKVHLSDYVPLSTEDKIKVTILEPKMNEKGHNGHGENSPYLDKNHNINWDLVIPAGETTEQTIKYSIDFPSSEEIDFDIVQQDD